MIRQLRNVWDFCTYKYEKIGQSYKEFWKKMPNNKNEKDDKIKKTTAKKSYLEKK